MKSALRVTGMIVAFVLVVLALLDQLVREPKYRDWNGDIFGVPYDFRAPTLERLQQRVWAPDSSRILVPIVFGVGWTVNLGGFANLLEKARSR